MYLSPLCSLCSLLCLDLHLKALAHYVLCSCVVPVLLGLPQTQAQAYFHPSLNGLCNACRNKRAPSWHPLWVRELSFYNSTKECTTMPSCSMHH